MRPHSTVSETPSPYSRITCQHLPTTNDRWVDEWPDQGYRRACKSKKSSKKSEMAASVLPTSNAYNDLRVKYHSVSGGSALSQSMKYAEAWLYGSLSVRMGASRAALFDGDGRGCGGSASVCRCSSVRLFEPAVQRREPDSSPPPSGCRTVGGSRGAPPSKSCCVATTRRQSTFTDPYDAVRRSRLGAAVPGQRQAPAAGHSPNDRDPQDTARRKSILDCDLSAYDLLRRTGGGEQTAGCASFSDEDVRRVAPAAVVVSTPAAGPGKGKKGQRKLTFGYKSRTKSKMAGEKLSSTPSPSSSKKCDEREATFVDDVSIAGQKIRIFNVFDRTHRDADGAADDWISDPNDEMCAPVEPQPEHVDVALAEDAFDETFPEDLDDAYPHIDCRFPERGNNRKESTPPRPPRRRWCGDEKCETNVPVVVVSPTTVASARIKSILKKPCAADEQPVGPHHRTVVDVTSFVWPVNADASVKTVAASSPSSLDLASGKGGGSRRGHLSTRVSSCSLDEHRRAKTMKMGGKIKKQVQFEGMRGDTSCSSGGTDDTGANEGASTTTAVEEDESGSHLTDDEDANLTAATETGYAIGVDLSITENGVAAADALGSLRDLGRSCRLACNVQAECSAASPSELTSRRLPSRADARPSTHPLAPRHISPPLQSSVIAPDQSFPLSTAPAHPTTLQPLQRILATTSTSPRSQSALSTSPQPSHATVAAVSFPSPPMQPALLVTTSSAETSAATPGMGFGSPTRRTINSTSLRKLERTLSECVSTRPSLVDLHRKSFADTMRLQMHANSRPADARTLFACQQRPPDALARPFSPAEAFHLALPDPGPLRLTIGPFSVFQSAGPYSTDNRSTETRECDARILVNHGDAETARIPSLTRTFLQNRRRPKGDSAVAVVSPASNSVIKIDIRSPPVSGGASATHNFCTVVTISSGPPELDEQLTPPFSRPKNNSVVRVNYVAASEPPYANHESVAVDSSAPTTSGSSYAVTAADNFDDDDSFDGHFSLHYMSCSIDGKLTEHEVGLVRTPPPLDELPGAEPIYEEIAEVATAPPPTPPPPPLPSRPPPDRVEDCGIIIPPRSIFEGASKYDILTYLAGAKERCRIPSAETPRFVIEEADADAEVETEVEVGVEGSGSLDVDVEDASPGVVAEVSPQSPPCSSHRGKPIDLGRRISHLSSVSDSSDELACFLACVAATAYEKQTRKNSAEIERNDSGVGSETSQCSRSKWQQIRANSPHEDQQLMCEDCDQVIESNHSENGSIFAPLVCRKCWKRRVERREIIAEIVETEEKYGRDLRIILDEFYKPMRVAGLLTAEQLSSVFLNLEELLEQNTMLAEKLRDGYEIAIEQGDEDLLTFNVGQIFLDATPMLHAFESYCTRQGNAALLLANLEREKELLKIFLRVSQMENTVLRRMNLNSFLMVPVQRVTKYPLLLARLYKVTPEHHVIQRELLKEARHHIELHLEHINSVTKDIGSTKIWRKISMINGRRVNGDIDDIINLKLQKIAVEVLEWSHDEVRFAMEGRLLYAQCTDCNWKRSGRTVKVVPINALLVTLGKPTENYNPELDDLLMFPQKNGIREVSLLLMKEKSGKYSLVREPLLLENCIIYCDGDYEEYFEVQEIHSKETYIFKAEDGERTKRWFRQLQYHCQGLGCWRKRRNALANIMMNGMKIRN